MTPRIVVALKTVGNDVVQTRRFRVRRTIATVRACVDRLAPWQVDELLLLSVDGPPSPALIADCAGRSDAPLTIGGGIRRLDEIDRALDAGADRCVLTTIALIDPPFVERAVERFGAHRIVVGIDAAWRPDGSVQAMAHGGRTPGGSLSSAPGRSCCRALIGMAAASGSTSASPSRWRGRSLTR